MVLELTTEIRTGRTVGDVLRILEIMFCGTVTNAGTGTVTFTGADGSTIVIEGDGAGNRTSVTVTLA